MAVVFTAGGNTDFMWHLGQPALLHHRAVNSCFSLHSTNCSWMWSLVKCADDTTPPALQVRGVPLSWCGALKKTYSSTHFKHLSWRLTLTSSVPVNQQHRCECGGLLLILGNQHFQLSVMEGNQAATIRKATLWLLHLCERPCVCHHSHNLHLHQLRHVLLHTRRRG